MRKFSRTADRFVFPGPVGDVEVMTSWPKELKSNTVAIICHPHPLFQGTMDNKVVTTLYKSFDQLGMPTLRFNFRGVGQSEGQHGGGEDEQQDVVALIDWLNQVLPRFKLVLAGFSFGSYVAAAVASHHSVAGLVSVAPPVHHYPFATLAKMTSPWLVLMGDEDEIVPVQAVRDFVANGPNLTYQEMPGVSHFFHGQLVPLREAVCAWGARQSW
jgi:alpha/beta superfamily hydrolase